jgi:chemotaxis protein methyltransferase CheR
MDFPMTSPASCYLRPDDVEHLLDVVYHRFHYDFRGYARASLERRLLLAQDHLACASLLEMTQRLLDEPCMFPRVLQTLSVQVSTMFRTPRFYRTFREQIVPILHTYPSPKIWVAGCSGGEEILSFAILLREEGLLERATIYGTDINAEALRRAEAGRYALDSIPTFAAYHARAGGKGDFSRYFTAGDGVATFDRTLLKRVTLADHDLATDSVFAEVQVISCRNVLLYFDDQLRDRVMSLFEGSLCRRGFFGIGSKETLMLSRASRAFHELSPPERWYQHRGA